MGLEFIIVEKKPANLTLTYVWYGSIEKEGMKCEVKDEIILY